MPIEEALNLLEALEVYAIQCYDTTQTHIYNVNQINSLEELNSYDYTSDYPEVLHF
jgi:hypothetical protein